MARRTNAEMAKTLGMRAAMYRQRALIAGDEHAQSVQSLVHRARLLAERINRESGPVALSISLLSAECALTKALDAWVLAQENKEREAQP